MADGQPQKRRGPKPDSKPALTRRQELNRQAQRTHRERKELYIKALEDEVLRLKEIYSNISQDKERLAAENRQLKLLLSQNGMSMTGALPSGSSLLDESSTPSVGGYSASVAGSASHGNAPSSHTSALTPPPLSAAAMGGHMGGGQTGSPRNGSQGHGHGHGHGHSHSHGQGQQTGGGPQRNPGLDYDQAGIDFVLTYDNPSSAYMSPPHE